MTQQTLAGDTGAESNRWERLKQEIKDAGPALGIDDIGFTTADPFLYLREVLEENRRKGYESGFEEPDLDKRIDPSLTLGGARSIIAIAVTYHSKMENPPKSVPGEYRGIMARSAWGLDYHTVLRNRMQRLEDFIRERVPEARIESMVDTGALSDRAVAHRAGIGFYGHNCAIISPKLGSWIFLGDMITDIPFAPDTPVTEDCGTCTKCIDACPTGALVNPGQLNSQICVSFLTQTKGMLSDEHMRKIGNRLYGCDTCQIVCPKNKGKSWSHQEELRPDPEKAKPLLLPILELSNKQFKQEFGDTSSAWRGKNPIQRNAIIALGNFKDKSAVPKLADMLIKDVRPVIRGTIAWALSRIGGEEALAAVKKGLEREQEHEVIERLLTAQHILEEALADEQQAGEQTGAAQQV